MHLDFGSLKLLIEYPRIENCGGLSAFYVCRKCGRQHSEEEYNEDRFCRNCKTFLSSGRLRASKRGGPTHAEMIADIIEELPQPFTTKQVVDAINEKYSGSVSINRGSLSVSVAACCVNLASREHCPGFPALLVSVGRGLYRRYNPAKDTNFDLLSQVSRGTYRPTSKGLPTIVGDDIFQDIEKAKKIGKTLHTLFETRTGFFKGYVMPEYVLPENIEEGSLEHALFLTFVISIDYQTDAVKLWQNARRTYSKSPEYFNPKNVVDMDLRALSSILRDLGARYPTNGAKAWKRISRILLEKYDGDPRNITPEPLTVIHAKRLIQMFPHLRGKKLSNFFLRVLGEKGLFKIKNLNELDIPVDVQVARFTFLTGCLKLTKGLEMACIHEPPVQPAIENVWRNVAENLDIAPWQLDEPIWTIGSKLCTRKDCAPCPVKHLCDKNFYIKIQGNKIYWK